MAKTAAQRQAAYRARRDTAGENRDGDRRLDLWIGTPAHLALGRLALRHGVPKRQMLEHLIRQADDAIVGGLDPDTPAWAEYFSVTR
ncbi:hypothetical protein [Burkholderia vietnamiensis]|uniref:hypothetical protein n=1 Tax=Burkholderia vietnamiensis TaxID=60552 RepID=UPI0008414509|nr:hypothetical protein [Burkholderia vietnamiensis]AOK00715.1 hypothetical protein WK23_19935 [Burkholderia vietnamiensis]